ncbi:unnamed protein product [Effrenium voratum]|nr:unnamed protein product [Effrenium voratum]
MDNSAQEPSISERQPQSRQSGVVLHTVRVSILTHGMQLLDLPEPQGDGAVVSALLSDVEHVTRSPRSCWLARSKTAAGVPQTAGL